MRAACAAMPPRTLRSEVSNGPDDAVAPAEPVLDDAVDVLDRGDAVAHEAVGLAQQRALQPVEDEALELDPHPHRREAGALEQRVRALDDVLVRERRRARSPRRAAGTAGCRDARRGSARGPGGRSHRGCRDRRGGAGENRLGRRQGIEPAQQVAASARAARVRTPARSAAPSSGAAEVGDGADAREDRGGAARRAARTPRGRRGERRPRRAPVRAARRRCRAARPRARRRLRATAQPMPIVPAPTIATCCVVLGMRRIS